MFKNTVKIRKGSTLFLKRHSSTVKLGYDDLESYLKYADLIKLNTNSTVFHGTTYEMRAKEKLENALKIKELRHSGGAFDNGIDLIGKLDVKDWKNNSDVQASYLWNGKRIKPLVTKKNTEVSILVQCKNFRQKIAAKEIRELSGIFNYHVRPSEKNNTIVIMTAPQTVTSQGIAQMNKVEMPLIFCQMSRLKLTGENKYDISSYVGGDIENFYFNPLAITLFQGTDFQLHATLATK